MATTDDGKLLIDLSPRIDSDGKKYFVGKLLAPILLDAKQGIAFLIFLSEENNETLQISSITVPKDRKDIKDIK